MCGLENELVNLDCYDRHSDGFDGWVRALGFQTLKNRICHCRGKGSQLNETRPSSGLLSSV